MFHSSCPAIRKPVMYLVYYVLQECLPFSICYPTDRLVLLHVGPAAVVQFPPLSSYSIVNEPPHDKTNKMIVRPAMTQISLGIRPVWSESSQWAQWVAEDPMFLHADSEDSDQTGRMSRLIWVFAGCKVTLLILSWGGSFHRFDVSFDIVTFPFLDGDIPQWTFYYILGVYISTYSFC